MGRIEVANLIARAKTIAWKDGAEGLEQATWFLSEANRIEREQAASHYAFLKRKADRDGNDPDRSNTKPDAHKTVEGRKKTRERGSAVRNDPTAPAS
jgi:hypothetical protein